MSKKRLRTKEKLKRSRLAAREVSGKKVTRKVRKGVRAHIFKIILWVSTIAVMLWALAGWYLGDKAEQVFKTYLQTHAEIAGEKLLRVELLNYQKTLFGAEAQLRLSSDISWVSEQVGEIAIRAKLLNGPLFITKRGVSVGSSRWFLKIDESNMREEERENIHALFPEALPTAIVRTDFKQKAHYLARLQTNFSHALVTGIYTLETAQQEEHNRGSITLDDFSYGILPNTLLAKKIHISYQHQKAITAGYKPGTTSIQIPELRIQSANLDKPILLKLAAKSDLSLEDDFLDGFLKLSLEQGNTASELPLDTAELSLSFKGLSSEWLVAVSDASANVDNLKQQVDWTLEDLGEFPEGRDEIIRLREEIKSASKTLRGTLVNKVFKSKNSLLHLEVETRQGDVTSHLSAELSPTEKGKEKEPGLAISLFEGKLEVSLSDEMHRFIEPLLKLNEKLENFDLKKKLKIDFNDLFINSKNNKLDL